MSVPDRYNTHAGRQLRNISCCYYTVNEFLYLLVLLYKHKNIILNQIIVATELCLQRQLSSLTTFDSVSVFTYLYIRRPKRCNASLCLGDLLRLSAYQSPCGNLLLRRCIRPLRSGYGPL